MFYIKIKIYTLRNIPGRSTNAAELCTIGGEYVEFL